MGQSDAQRVDPHRRKPQREVGGLPNPGSKPQGAGHHAQASGHDETSVTKPVGHASAQKAHRPADQGHDGQRRSGGRRCHPPRPDQQGDERQVRSGEVPGDEESKCVTTRVVPDPVQRQVEDCVVPLRGSHHHPHHGHRRSHEGDHRPHSSPAPRLGLHDPGGQRGRSDHQK